MTGGELTGVACDIKQAGNCRRTTPEKLLVVAKCGEHRTLLTVTDQNCSLSGLDFLGHADLLDKAGLAMTWSMEMLSIEQ